MNPVRLSRYLLNKWGKKERCDSTAQHAGVGVADRSRIYCMKLKHHSGPHVDYSGKREWYD